MVLHLRHTRNIFTLLILTTDKFLLIRQAGRYALLNLSPPRVSIGSDTSLNADSERSVNTLAVKFLAMYIHLTIQRMIFRLLNSGLEFSQNKFALVRNLMLLRLLRLLTLVFNFLITSVRMFILFVQASFFSFRVCVISGLMSSLLNILAVLSLVFMCKRDNVIVNDKVVFYKTNEILTTRLATIVIDFDQIDNFQAFISADIKNPH